MTKKVLSTLEFQLGAGITGLPAAVGNTEPVILSQLLATINGNPFKDDCRAATVGNISLASAVAAYDGITMAAGDRLLVRAQTNQTENGIYVFTSVGAPLTRATDADAFDELEGAIVIVTEGTTLGQTRYRQTQVNGVIGTNNVIWVADVMSVPAASETISGIQRNATQAEADAGTLDTVTITPLKLANSVYANRALAQVIGDGTATTYNINHTFNTRNVSVDVYTNSGNFDDVIVEVRRPSTTQVSVVFAGAPASNAYVVVVSRNNAA